MALFRFSCPSCQTPLEAQTQWRGMELTCPTCGNRVRVPDASDSGPAFPDGSDETPRSRYVFGRLYITLSRIIALLLFFGAAGIMLLQLRSTRQSQAELAPDPAVVTALIRQQNRIVADYNSIARRLSGRSGDAGSGFRGVRLSSDAFRWKHPFNELLTSEEEVGESIAAVEETREKVAALQKLLHNYLLENLAALRERLGVSDATTPAGGGATSAINLSLQQTSPIFKPEVEEFLRTRAGQLVRSEFDGIQRNSSSSTLVRQARNWLAFWKYLDAELLTRDPESSRIGGLSGNFPKAEVEAAESRASEHERAVLKLSTSIANYIARGTGNSPRWLIEEQLDQLENDLNDYQAKCRAAARQSRKLWSDFAIHCTANCAVTFLAMLFLLVIADFLRAHFDMADRFCREK